MRRNTLSALLKLGLSAAFISWVVIEAWFFVHIVIEHVQFALEESHSINYGAFIVPFIWPAFPLFDPTLLLAWSIVFLGATLLMSYLGLKHADKMLRIAGRVIFGFVIVYFLAIPILFLLGSIYP